MSVLIDTLTATDPRIRDRDLAQACAGLELDALLAEADALDAYWRTAPNLYLQVRAQLFLHALHRYHLPPLFVGRPAGRIPYAGHVDVLERRFVSAIDRFRAAATEQGAGDALSSALAEAYRGLAFQTLADQVRRSVRASEGNGWLFEPCDVGHHRLRIQPELSAVPGRWLRERVPVRMDLTHCGWSDIFFLGMDFPEGARVLNISIDLAVRGSGAPRPPVEALLRVIDTPVLRLVSADLDAETELTTLGEVFDFARDYLGLLKAAVVASGLVPPSLEGAPDAGLAPLLAGLVGPGRGLELVSRVHGIPKGSRLAVSTTLLAALIAVCMRATGQTAARTGPLTEAERRLIASRAILGEWLAGSGGGWQDSGGLWPGIKLIEGALAGPGDPEHGISRGCLLPQHRLLEADKRDIDAALAGSLVLVHGGMAQNVGPILEMVTEKYLLRSQPAWDARKQTLGLLDQILAALERRDVRALGDATTRNFRGPLTTIIPWATNAYTERLIARATEAFGPDFWGFWMLGGMSGGGMGFMFAPHRHAEALRVMQQILDETRTGFEHALPFAMAPVVYDFAVNHTGAVADWCDAGVAAQEAARLDSRAAAGAATQANVRESATSRERALREILADNGFDPQQHERIRSDLQRGHIGLAHNRIPAHELVEDVRPGDVIDLASVTTPELERRGARALASGEVVTLSLAAGAGSRWTQGAGVAKALHPFCRMAGEHRRFVDVHIAQTRRAGRAYGARIPHLISTSYLTHAALVAHLASRPAVFDGLDVRLSPGRAIGLRMIPMVRDLRFLWEELPQQQLDARQQRMREGARAALQAWARTTGEGSDYLDNLPAQCLHPVGHWFEAPNLLRNGVLAALLRERPALRTLQLRNIDTVGADLDPRALGVHLAAGAAFTFEVIGRRMEDRGGGLARVEGRLRIVESLAMPREEDEFKLSFYNTMTTWIDIDGLLRLFGLTRADLDTPARVDEAVRALSARLPTYVTLKDVKRRWGYGQEDVFPVCQFEKLWSDISALPGADCRYVLVPRARGQQLKDPAQLDGWMRDGSAAFVEGLCDFG